MMTITVLANQTMIDIAMQYLGDVERVFELCLINNRSLTDDLTPGELLQVPAADADKRRVVSVFNQPGQQPASADDMGVNFNPPPGGIGYMRIGYDFKVS